jgi:hypothetical protein
MLPIGSNRRSPHTPNTRSIVSAAKSSLRVSPGTLRTRFFDSEGVREAGSGRPEKRDYFGTQILLNFLLCSGGDLNHFTC